MYRLPNVEVKLLANTVEKLKEWNQKYPTVLYDSKYLKKLAIDVFGIECIRSSSVYGTPARNSNVQHNALDATKLNFIRGICVIFIHN